MALSVEIVGGTYPPHIDLGKRAVKRLLKQNRPPILMRQYEALDRGTAFLSNSTAICLIPGNGIGEPETPFPLDPFRAGQLASRIERVRLELRAEAERRNQKKA